jgi:hypothetical protein
MRRLYGEGSRSYLGRSRLVPERVTVLSRSEKSADAVGMLAAVPREVWIFIGLTIIVVGVYFLWAQHRTSRAEDPPVVPQRGYRAVRGANQAPEQAYRPSAVVGEVPEFVGPALMRESAPAPAPATEPVSVRTPAAALARAPAPPAATGYRLPAAPMATSVSATTRLGGRP